MADDIDVSAEEDIERMLEGLKDDPMLADVLDKAEVPAKAAKPPKVKVPKAQVVEIAQVPVEVSEVKAEDEPEKDPDKDIDIDDDLVPRNLPASVPAPQAGAIIGGAVDPLSPLTKSLSDPRPNDKLVQAIKRDKPTATVLGIVMQEIAEEAAFIKAWRNANWDTAADLSESTARRVKMLTMLVESIVNREKLKEKSSVGKIDFYSENFQKVLKYFLETIKATFDKVGIPDQYAAIFFAQLAKEFDGFEKKAEKIYYQKDSR
jgi:hypothetical protein